MFLHSTNDVWALPRDPTLRLCLPLTKLPSVYHTPRQVFHLSTDYFIIAAKFCVRCYDLLRSFHVEHTCLLQLMLC